MHDKIDSNKCVNVSKPCVRDVLQIDGCKYIINSYFPEKAADTVTKKLEKLILKEALKDN